MDVDTDTAAATVRLLHGSLQPIEGEALDRLFGLEFDLTEEAIPGSKYPKDIWRKGPKQNTQTLYRVIRTLFQNITLSETDVFYDVGSGYGRVLLYGASLYPQTVFRGVELVTERALEAERTARRAGLFNVKVINDNVLNVDLSKGSIFYFFNPFPRLMKTVLDRLQQVASSRKLTIATTGRTTADIAQTPWLEVVKSFAPHDGFLCIFESK